MILYFSRQQVTNLPVIEVKKYYKQLITELFLMIIINSDLKTIPRRSTKSLANKDGVSGTECFGLIDWRW